MADLGISWHLSILVANEIEQTPDPKSVLGLVWGDEEVAASVTKELADLVPALFEQTGCLLEAKQSIIIDQDLLQRLAKEPAARADDPVEVLDEILPAEKLVGVSLDADRQQLAMLEILDGSVTQRLWLDASKPDQPVVQYQGQPGKVLATLLDELGLEAEADALAFTNKLKTLIQEERDQALQLIEAWALDRLAKVLGFSIAEAPDSFWSQGLTVYEPV